MSEETRWYKNEEGLTPMDLDLMKKVYNSAGGLMRGLLRTQDQQRAAALAYKGKLVFTAAPYQLGYAFDQWTLPQSVDITDLRDSDHENDHVNQAVLWNDGEDDDEEWLERRNEPYDDEEEDDYYDDEGDDAWDDEEDVDEEDW